MSSTFPRRVSCLVSCERPESFVCTTRVHPESFNEYLSCTRRARAPSPMLYLRQVDSLLSNTSRQLLQTPNSFITAHTTRPRCTIFFDSPHPVIRRAHPLNRFGTFYTTPNSLQDGRNRSEGCSSRHHWHGRDGKDVRREIEEGRMQEVGLRLLLGVVEDCD